MTAKVTVVPMTQRFALITHRFPKSDLLLGKEDQPGSAFTARNMEKVGTDQKQRFTGRSVAGSTPAGARTGAGARAQSAHGYAGARGEGAAKTRVGEVVR